MRLVTLGLWLLLAIAGPLEARGQQPPAKPPAPRPATAPSPPPVLLTAGGGFQLASTSFSDSRTEQINVEPSRWDARYHLENSPSFTVGLGVRVWRELMAGVTYTHVQQDTAATISGQIPHPFFFNQPRPFDGEASSLRHLEQGVHVSAMWSVPLGRRLELMLAGGPSLFRVERGLVERVTYSEEYPYDSIRFASAVTRQVSETGIGAHAGADVTWLFTPRVGVSFLARFSRASMDFASPTGSAVSVDVGGFQTGVGLRVGFGGRRSAPSRPRPGR